MEIILEQLWTIYFPEPLDYIFAITTINENVPTIVNNDEFGRLIYAEYDTIRDEVPVKIVIVYEYKNDPPNKKSGEIEITKITLEDATT